MTTIHEVPVTRDATAHRRHVSYAAGHYFGVCSCGWIGRGTLVFERALVEPCEVDMLLADSAVRARRFLSDVEFPL